MERNVRTSGDFITPEGSLNDLIAGGGGGGGASINTGSTADRPADAQNGDIYFDTDLDQLLVYTGMQGSGTWYPVGGENVTVNSGVSASRPDGNKAVVGTLFWDTELDALLVYDGNDWQPATPDDVAVLEEIVLQDKVTDAEIVISVRDGALTVTNPFTESVSTIDLGGTTPDPGKLSNVFLDGTGRYAVGPSTVLNANGLITLEYINSPGQFFVIDDVDGANFGPGDRQGFGLVAEDIVDGSDLRGGPAPFSGGTAGGWSINYTWFYTGGFPYAWTYYSQPNQTPGGSGMATTGTFSNQNDQRNWWYLCGAAGVGKKMRWGIANGELTDQAGRDFSNRLICQMYVAQEMIDHPDATLLPAEVRNNGAGWYTQAATNANFENLGQFDNGQDKGYRFRWSTFGNTALNQLPFLTGVSSNDQITAASGESHYIVYDVAALDKNAANSVLASGVIGPNNRLHPQGTTVDILQYLNPFSFPETNADNVFDLKYSYLGAVQASPLFNNYPVSNIDEITTAGIAVAPLEKLHAEVCDEVRQAVTAYYLVRDFDAANTALVTTKLSAANAAAVAGQLITTYDAVNATVADDASGEGTAGEVLFPQALKDAILEKLEFWMNTLPDN